ncbi:MAG: hypothetical protein JSR21_16120 [Proteobacteria bacterium]|nr:hypothetical protein [Pseudomonadota bacterium]
MAQSLMESEAKFDHVRPSAYRDDIAPGGGRAANGNRPVGVPAERMRQLRQRLRAVMEDAITDDPALDQVQRAGKLRKLDEAMADGETDLELLNRPFGLIVGDLCRELGIDAAAPMSRLSDADLAIDLELKEAVDAYWAAEQAEYEAAGDDWRLPTGIIGAPGVPPAAAAIEEARARVSARLRAEREAHAGLAPRPAPDRRTADGAAPSGGGQGAPGTDGPEQPQPRRPGLFAPPPSPRSRGDPGPRFGIAGGSFFSR